MTAEQTDSVPLVIWDFDHSLIEPNSDTEIVRVLEGEAFTKSLFAELQRVEGGASEGKERVWTDVMDAVMGRLHERGHAEKALKGALARMELPAGNRAALLHASAQGAGQVIVSDANTFFISTILEAQGLTHLFQGAGRIFTNPAWFDPSLPGRLRVSYHDADPHGCPLCPRNLCKGRIAARLVDSLKPSLVLYVGDGGGDFCPCLRLREGDVVFAREGWTLHRRLLKEGSRNARVLPRVFGWKDGQELLQLFQTHLPAPAAGSSEAAAAAVAEKGKGKEEGRGGE